MAQGDRNNNKNILRTVSTFGNVTFKPSLPTNSMYQSPGRREDRSWSMRFTKWRKCCSSSQNSFLLSFEHTLEILMRSQFIIWSCLSEKTTLNRSNMCLKKIPFHFSSSVTTLLQIEFIQYLQSNHFSSLKTNLIICFFISNVLSFYSSFVTLIIMW